MLLKQSDQIVLEKKVNIKPINYAILNQLSEDFGKRFVPQQELSSEQAFWFQMSNPSTKSSYSSHVKVDVPSELPKLYMKTIDSWIKISQDVVNTVVNSSVDINECVNADKCNKCLELKTELFKDATQLNQKIFQRDNFASNQSAPNCNQYFELNELKAQSQEKDTVIRKLKERIKCLSENKNVENVKKDIDEMETTNIELEHSVAKLLSENEHLHNEIDHLKQIYKDQFDSIKRTRVRNNEHSESLILQLC
ncbi:hypothetical protein Tco_0734685 [Tanacetum coccineum]